MDFDERTNASPSAARSAVGELQELMMATEDVEAFLQQLVEIAVAGVGGGISAAVTVARNGQPATVVSSDVHAAQCDEIQYGHDDGPCLTAMRAGRTILIDNLATDDRFLRYRPFALALGVRSSLSLPLRGGNDSVGALNLYSRRAHAFGPRELADAQRFADEASRALNMVVRVARHVEMTDQLRSALTSRTIIDQAVGILMGERRCDAETAFAILRSTSQHRNVRLRVIAAELILAVEPALPPDGHSLQN